MIALNAAFGWCWITLGFLSGMLMGLRFYREDWLGGYNSWRRRLLRLGHIATVALGMLNVLFAVSASQLPLPAPKRDLISWAFVIGAVTMPLVCALAAWRQPLRHLFFIPVASLLTAVITLSIEILRSGAVRP